LAPGDPQHDPLGAADYAEAEAATEECVTTTSNSNSSPAPFMGSTTRLGTAPPLFAFFAGMAESEREYIREKSLEGQASARERGRHGGRPKVVDDDMAAYARSLRANGVPVPEIVRNLVIISGKNQGKHPSVATVYRILAEDEPES
jgi:DNA invertase Pin-like site-specific DNA recombinase